MFESGAVLEVLIQNYFSNIRASNRTFPAAIFGVPKAGKDMSKKQANIISFTSLMARQRILLLWRKLLPLSPISWPLDTSSFLELERSIFP